MNQVLVPRPAATLILVRDTSGAMEVLMIRRTQSAAFMGGAHVFPGGGVDASDASAELAAHCEGLDDAEASRLLSLERGGLPIGTQRCANVSRKPGCCSRMMRRETIPT